MRGGSSEKKLNLRRLKGQASERQKRDVLTLVNLEKLINKGGKTWFRIQLEGELSFR